MIQDDIIAAVGFVFALSLVPTLLNPKSVVVPSGLLLMTWATWTLGLTLSSLGLLAQAVLWAGIAIFRGPPRVVPQKETTAPEWCQGDL